MLGNKVFILTKHFNKEFPIGTIVIQSDTVMYNTEYFNMTIEMATGESYTTYNIPSDIMQVASDKLTEQVRKFIEKES